MTFTGSGGADIIQLNPVESHTQETTFLKYPIVLDNNLLLYLFFLSIVLSEIECLGFVLACNFVSEGGLSYPLFNDMILCVG